MGSGWLARFLFLSGMERVFSKWETHPCPSQEGIIPYRAGMVERARKLRKESTKTEVILWEFLKKKKLGFDFDRQKPLLGFIVDFYCKSLRLAIEIDGASHNDKCEYDLERELAIKRYGVHFLRFTANEIEHDLENVLQTIKTTLLKIPSWEG